MPDSSLKSDGYKKFLTDAAVPSTPVCFFIASVILLSYGDTAGIYGRFFSCFFSILFFASSFLVVSRYKEVLADKKILVSSILAALVICAASSYTLNNRINSMLNSDGIPEHIANIEIEIDDLLFRRYSNELYFTIPDHGNRLLKGILYYQGNIKLNAGDRIFIHKRIYRVKNEPGRHFNRYLLTRGIHHSGYINDNDITVIKKNEAPVRAYIQKSLLERIDHLFRDPANGVVKALLTGNQNYIEKRIIISYRDSGVLHTLSASGLHVAIFASIPAFLLLPFFRRNMAATISFFTVLFYLFITDTPISLLRAVIMYGFFFAQLLLFRRRNAFNYLMLTCSVLLLASPWEIFSPGFQLSFAATAGILIFYRQFRKSVSQLPAYIADSTAVSLSAQVFTIPIILVGMNQFNTAGIFTNIIIIPLITVIMVMSLAAIGFSFIYLPFAALTGDLTGLLLKISLFITEHAAKLRLNFHVPVIDPVLLFLILAGLIPIFNYRTATKLKFYPVIISALISTLYLKNIHQTRTGENIHAGLSRSASIRFENNRQILRLDLKDVDETESIINEIKGTNSDINIIELADSSGNNILASRRIMNDYVIDELRLNNLIEINNQFKALAFQLEKDNIALKLTGKSGY